MNFRRLRCMMVTSVLTVGTGCEEIVRRTAVESSPVQARTRPLRPQAKTTPTVTDYPLKGVVKKVENELEHVTIQHEAIPGFMAAMRMRFAYKDKTMLGKLRPGEQVEGTLRVERFKAPSLDHEIMGSDCQQARGRHPRRLLPISPRNKPFRVNSRGASKSAIRCPNSP